MRRLKPALQTTDQTNEQLANYSASPDFLLDLLDFMKSGDRQYLGINYRHLGNSCFPKLMPKKITVPFIVNNGTFLFLLLYFITCCARYSARYTALYSAIYSAR